MLIEVSEPPASLRPMTKKDPSKQSKGGQARAAKLTPEQRSAIARKGGMARWEGVERVARATHEGPLRIGTIEMDCAVLEDGRRVISDAAFRRALGRANPGGQTYERRGFDPLPIYVALKGLKPYIPKGFSVSTVSYTPKSGGGVAKGVEATVIPEVCNIWLRAREGGALQRQQLRTAARAELIVRGLAEVGIVALVDEATGYQSDRARDALAAILEQFIAKELARWAKAFDEDYYRHLFRLRGMTYDDLSTKRPAIIGRFTNEIVYQRLAPGVLEELQRKNPKVGRYRRARHHQWLTRDHGHPALTQHLHLVIGLMRASDDWEQFLTLLDRAAPSPQLALDLRLPKKRAA